MAARAVSGAYALETVGLAKNFGGLAVTRQVDFRLPHRARNALIGPNGAGKSTLINLLTGALMPSAGRVLLDGADVTEWSQEARVAAGLVRTFQINTLFPGLSPLESVTLAICERNGIGARAWRRLAACADEIDEAAELLDRLGFGADAERTTRTLAYGRQRALEIALALALRPKVLLLDEPAAGVPRGESAALFELIAALPDEVAVLFIEHDMELVARFARHVTVLVAGRILTEGTPAEIARNEEVQEVYLGTSAHG